MFMNPLDKINLLMHLFKDSRMSLSKFPFFVFTLIPKLENEYLIKINLSIEWIDRKNKINLKKIKKVKIKIITTIIVYVII